MASDTPTIRTEFAPENISIVAGINELKSSFGVLLFHYLSVHENSLEAVDIHHRFAPGGGFGHDETSNSELFKRIM